MTANIDLTKPLPRGAIPTPRSELAAARPYVPPDAIAAPPTFLMWPVQMSSWNNYVYGDCVTAEEAFAKATAAPQVFIPEATVVAWAQEHGYLNGANLTDVMKSMQSGGFPLDNDVYDDGGYYSVEWTNAGILQSAIYSQGPVKIGVGAGDFQSNAHGSVTPGTSGWAMYNYPTGQGEDHCVSLCGYGTLSALVGLFQEHGVTVQAPSGMPTGLCYALFTWNSIGIVDQQSMLNMTYEAWVRNPVTIVHQPSPIAPGSALDGYASSWNNQQHVNFAGTDNHVHELVYKNSWGYTDLMAVTGAPDIAPGSALDGYVSAWNSQQHVNFIGTDGHLHEIVYKDNWSNTDLTAAAGAPAPTPGSALDGYVTPWNNQQHVNFIAGFHHVYEIVYKDSWGFTDLTAVSGAPDVASGSQLDGYATPWNSQQHVNYIGPNNHVYEIVYKDSWGNTDLMAASGAPAAAAGSALAGYASTWNNQQHVNYIGTDNHVYEIVYKDSWGHTDLTAAAGAPAAAPGSALDGYTSGGNQLHVDYIGADHHVHELYFDTAWHHTDLTAAAGAPAAAAGSPLDGYISSGNQQHVNFVGTDNHVHELYFDGAWHHTDLTTAGVSGTPRIDPKLGHLNLPR
ncbi:MAG TPA: hypothetical protein VKU87_11945 [Thermomicrobiaceae bacterium]|nr:hypothetical protein [Thermomicrobiaceae bacterium]